MGAPLLGLAKFIYHEIRNIGLVFISCRLYVLEVHITRQLQQRNVLEVFVRTG